MSTIPTPIELKTLYDNLTDAQIAEQLGVSAATIRRWRRQFQIPSKPKGTRGGQVQSRVPLVSDEMLRDIVPSCHSVADVCRQAGLTETGAGHRKMQERIILLGLDTAHFGKKRRRVLGTLGTKLPLSALLGKAKTNITNLKSRLLSEGLLEERCTICGLGPEWYGTRLSLHLDHLDGDRENNTLSNLRMLCPNCHSQTITYAGRNKGKTTKTDSLV